MRPYFSVCILVIFVRVKFFVSLWCECVCVCVCVCTSVHVHAKGYWVWMVCANACWYNMLVMCLNGYMLWVAYYSVGGHACLCMVAVNVVHVCVYLMNTDLCLYIVCLMWCCVRCIGEEIKGQR